MGFGCAVEQIKFLKTKEGTAMVQMGDGVAVERCVQHLNNIPIGSMGKLQIAWVSILPLLRKQLWKSLVLSECHCLIWDRSIFVLIFSLLYMYIDIRSRTFCQKWQIPSIFQIIRQVLKNIPDQRTIDFCRQPRPAKIVFNHRARLVQKRPRARQLSALFFPTPNECFKRKQCFEFVILFF